MRFQFFGKIGNGKTGVVFDPHGCVQGSRVIGNSGIGVGCRYMYLQTDRGKGENTWGLPLGYTGCE